MLQIKSGEAYLNGKHSPSPPKSLFEYEVLSTVGIDDFPERGEWSQPLVTQNGDTLKYIIKLTAEQAADYNARKPAVLSVRKKLAEYEPGDTFLAKPCASCQWTVDNFGPLRIPAPGDIITVDAVNFKLYHNIPGIQPGKNIIKEQLYFLLGDNRHGAQDSRYIGFISHSKMYGIVK